MRQLRFVRPADDGTHLIVETHDGSEQFHLRCDEWPREMTPPVPAAAPMSAPEPAQPAPVAAIGPREIQTRVRAGESPQELADACALPIERILRFAEPVMDERLRIAAEARRARAHRSVPEGAESKIVVFGEAVDSRFTAHGIVPADVTWDARRRDDGGWIVVAGWLGGEGQHCAEWLFHRSSRSVTPLDETATDLLSDRPIRPVVPAAPQRPSLVGAPPLAPGVVAFPTLHDAQTGPLPALEDVFDQEADEAPQAEHEQLPPPLLPAGADEGLNFDAPPLPLGITDARTRPSAVPGIANLRNLSVPKRNESDEDRAARARVPSWDDILLGVRRKDD